MWNDIEKIVTRAPPKRTGMQKLFWIIGFFWFVGFSALNGASARSITRGNDMPIQYSYSPKDISDHCHHQIDLSREQLDVLAKEKSTSFISTALTFEKILTQLNNSVTPIVFLKYVSTDAAVRKEADQCELEFQKYFVDIFTREDLYLVLKKVKTQSLSRVDKRLLDEHLVQFRRNGLGLSKEKRDIFREKKKKLVALETQFSQNLIEWKDHLEVSEAELKGLPKPFVDSLAKTDNDKFKLTLDYPTYFMVMENAQSDEVRKNLEFKFNNRGGKKNRELLADALKLRFELATMLGFKDHAEYVLDRRMANKPDVVVKFLAKLRSRLTEPGKKNLEELLKLKREEHLNNNLSEIYSWEWRYYDNKLKQKKYLVDHQVLKEYFPAEKVLKGLFDTYETLLSVKFVEEANAPLWEKSVKCFRIKDGKKTLAFFYLDLFPRDGKYNHAAAFPLILGHEKKDGTYQIPHASMVANFSPPTKDMPSLLEHSQIETLFHEFGHLMHQLLTRAKYATFSGTNVKTDFVEAPSQMLENWAWDKVLLKKISGHYKDTEKTLPDSDIEKLIGSRLANSGIRYLRQVGLATIDMAYHTADKRTLEKIDTTEVYRKTMKDIYLIPTQDGTMPEASFGHLMGGYDAGYYGYLWSRVFAEDMFTRFEKEGLLNPKIGQTYRKWILEPGGEKEPDELIKGFLGRKPNEKAFLKSIGVEEK